jgi:hypothetical protein
MPDDVPATAWSFDTLAAHAGEAPVGGEDAGGVPDASGWRPTSTPIHNASGFYLPSLDALDDVFAGRREGYFYTRDGNPTVRAFEEAVAALEGAPMVAAYGSGMAAIHAAVLAAGVGPGDAVLATRDLYGLTRVLFTTHFAQLGVRVQFVDMADLAGVERALAERPKAVYLETISNPLVKVLDLPSLTRMARAAGATVLVDNTFPSPYLLRPIEHGADLVIHSATKYLGGHGDVTGGTVAAPIPRPAPGSATWPSCSGRCSGRTRRGSATAGSRRSRSGWPASATTPSRSPAGSPSTRASNGSIIRGCRRIRGTRWRASCSAAGTGRCWRSTCAAATASRSGGSWIACASWRPRRPSATCGR